MAHVKTGKVVQRAARLTRSSWNLHALPERFSLISQIITAISGVNYRSYREIYLFKVAHIGVHYRDITAADLHRALPFAWLVCRSALLRDSRIPFTNRIAILHPESTREVLVTLEESAPSDFLLVANVTGFLGIRGFLSQTNSLIRHFSPGINALGPRWH